MKDILSVALQGFCNVGSHSARLIAEKGGKIVAAGDHEGGVANYHGLDVAALSRWVTRYGSVKGFHEGEAFDSSEVNGWNAQVLIPAALGNVLTAENATKVKARFIFKGANAPTTPEVAENFQQRGIQLAPDILASAGGVSVSYF